VRRRSLPTNGLASRLPAAVAVLLVCTAVTVAATAQPTMSARFDIAPVSVQRATRLLTQTTVQVLALGCNLANRQGSAVIVGPGRLLTNAHVVVDSRLIDLSADDAPTVVAGVPSLAQEGDVAVVDASGISTPGLTLAPTDPKVGDPVRVAGFPSSPPGQRPVGLVITPARVIGTLAGGDVGQPAPVLRLSIAVEPGMSGGPVLDQQGDLAGIVFGNEVPTGQALAIPASALRRVLGGDDLEASACG
jgi:S1-C subfamily serine protease